MKIRNCTVKGDALSEIETFVCWFLGLLPAFQLRMPKLTETTNFEVQFHVLQHLVQFVWFFIKFGFVPLLFSKVGYGIAVDWILWEISFSIFYPLSRITRLTASSAKYLTTFFAILQDKYPMSRIQFSRNGCLLMFQIRYRLSST